MKTILCLTRSDDIHADKVLEIVTQIDPDISIQRINFNHLNTEQISFDAHSLQSGKFSDIVLWTRCLDFRKIDMNNIDSYAKKWVQNEWQEIMESMSHLCKRAMNPINSLLVNKSKIHQSEIAQESGLIVPDWLITNDITKAMRFVKNHQAAAIKPLHPDLIIDQTGKVKTLFANKITLEELSLFSELGPVPIYFQKYVEKALELRITVIGNDIFACEIHSQESQSTMIDWRRYDIPNTPHFKHQLPPELAEKIFRFMEKANLVYGAFDFILTPENEYVFLEVNPMGQWMWIEDLTKMPISRSIANWLCA